MRAAIRGDFERLAQRRGSQELMHEAAPEMQDETLEEDVQEEQLAQLQHEPVVEDVAPEPEQDDTAAPDEIEEPARKGFFARLLGL
jgi:hypothetical protein